MNEIVLYYHPFSNCSQRVLLLLEEKGLSYQKRVINLIKSEQLQEPFLAINPKGRVPAIAYKDKNYVESCDIMLWLDDEFPDTRFKPADPFNLHVMNEFLQLAKHSHDCVKDFVYANEIGRLPTDEELAIYDKIDPENANFHHRRRQGKVGCDLIAASKRVEDDFMLIEQALSGQEWIAKEFSLADMAWFPNTIIFRQCGFDFSDMPNVMAWIARMESRASYKNSFAKEVGRVPAWLFRPLMKYKRLFQPSRR